MIEPVELGVDLLREVQAQTLRVPSGPRQNPIWEGEVGTPMLAYSVDIALKATCCDHHDWGTKLDWRPASEVSAPDPGDSAVVDQQLIDAGVPLKTDSVPQAAFRAISTEYGSIGVPTSPSRIGFWRGPDGTRRVWAWTSPNKSTPSSTGSIISGTT